MMRVFGYLDPVAKSGTSSIGVTESVTMEKSSVDALMTRNAALESEVKQLRQQMDWFRRQMFGHKTEKLPPGWDAQVALGQDLFGQDLSTSAPDKIHVPAHDRKVLPKVGHGRSELPEDLPREEIVLEVPESEKTCPCCSQRRVHIGDDTREELHLIQPRFVVRRYRRPKYACRKCTEEGVAQAEPAVCVIDKGIPSVELVVWIVLSKYMDHLPLYRIASQFKRWGVDVAESTMVGWIAAAFDLLGPIHRALEREIRQSGWLHVDETTLKVQRGEKDKFGSGKASTDYLWAMLGRGPDGTPIGVSFLHADGRQHAVAGRLLKDVMTGSVMSDGYGAYESLLKDRPGVVHAACWAHVRRKFHEARQVGEPAADKPLKLIGHLYKAHQRVDAFVSDLCRRAARHGQNLSQDRIDEIVVDRRTKWAGRWIKYLQEWNHQARIDALSKGKLGTAIGYLHSQGPRLEQYLSHARTDLDNNIIERAIRPIAIGRKNWLFAGSEDGAERTALLISLVGTCKMLDIDPVAYFADVLLRVRMRPDGDQCQDLTPSKWKIAQNNR